MTDSRARRSDPKARTTGDEPPLGRGPRPASIELASAALIVSGVLGTFVTALALPAASQLGAGVIGVISIAVYAVSVIVGILIRYGRAWILDVNYVAVLGFLDVTWTASGSQLALLFAIVDILVFVAVFVQRPWFVGPASTP